MLKQGRWWLLGILVVVIGAVSASVFLHEKKEGLRHEEGASFAAPWPVSTGSAMPVTYCLHDVYGYVDAVAAWQGCMGGWHPISQKQYRIGIDEAVAFNELKNSVDEVHETDRSESISKAIKDHNRQAGKEEADLNTLGFQESADAKRPGAVVEILDLENATNFASILDNEGYAIEILNHDEEDGSILFGITSRGKKAMAHVFKNGVLLFRSYWVGQDHIKLQEINEWNYNHRFARMYIDDDNDIVLQTDIMIPDDEFQSRDISFHTNMFFELKRVAGDWISKFIDTNSYDIPENKNMKESSNLNT